MTRNRKGAFTLVELLVVIAIMGILISGLSLTLIGNQSAGAKQGAVEAQAVFAQARNEAIRTGGTALVVVDADPNGTVNTYLKRMMVADYDATTKTVTQVSEWYPLPSSVSFDAATGNSDGNYTTLTIYNGAGQMFPSSSASGKNAYVYAFNPSGQLVIYPDDSSLTSVPTQFLVAVAHQNSSQIAPLTAPLYMDQNATAPTADTRFGFVIHQLGRVSFFQNASEMGTAPITH